MQRYSRQREAILCNLRNRYDHPTADMIYADLKQTNPKLSLGTVYRNLALLCEAGDILKVGASPDGKERYDGHIQPHAHFFCERCGTVYDIAEYFDVKKLEKALGAKINYANNTLHGICRGCLDKQN